jgi:hypothetical protein
MAVLLRIMVFVAAAFGFWAAATSTSRLDEVTPGWCDLAGDVAESDSLPEPVQVVRPEAPSQPLASILQEAPVFGRELPEHRPAIERPPIA